MYEILNLSSARKGCHPGHPGERFTEEREIYERERKSFKLKREKFTKERNISLEFGQMLHQKPASHIGLSDESILHELDPRCDHSIQERQGRKEHLANTLLLCQHLIKLRNGFGHCAMIKLNKQCF